MNTSKNVTLIGAGLVGSLLSTYLNRQGYKVTAYERRPDMRKSVIAAGRSINLALSDRGWRGLKGAGLVDAVKEVAIPMSGRMIHSIDGKTAYQPYAKEGQAIYSVSRGGLNCVLMDQAEQNGTVIHYNERCIHVDLENNTAVFENVVTGIKKSVTSDLLISSDGAFSAGRLSLMLSDRYNYSQHYLEHGYKELEITANSDGTHKLEKNVLHIWPRGGYMLIALPNMDGSFTCTLFFPFRGDPSFEMLDTENKLVAFFDKVFPGVKDMMPGLTTDFFANPTGSLMTVKCFPWTWKDKLMLIGDAAHAIVPFYGQGMNCGFEDCVELDELITKHDHQWNKIMSEFEKQRKPNADAIADLALANFIEMRDLVGHPDFLLRKKIEAWFSDKHPDKWIPLYTMVTFSEMPYSMALGEGKKHDAIMDKIMAIPEIETKWNSTETENLILEMLS